jgi:hypothetical protein
MDRPIIDEGPDERQMAEEGYRLGVLQEAWDMVWELGREGALTERMRQEAGTLLKELRLVVEGVTCRPYRHHAEVREAWALMSAQRTLRGVGGGGFPTLE